MREYAEFSEARGCAGLPRGSGAAEHAVEAGVSGACEGMRNSPRRGVARDCREAVPPNMRLKREILGDILRFAGRGQNTEQRKHA